MPSIEYQHWHHVGYVFEVLWQWKRYHDIWSNHNSKAIDDLNFCRLSLFQKAKKQSKKFFWHMLMHDLIDQIQNQIFWGKKCR